MEKTTGRDETIVCHIAECSVTGPIAHLIQADVVSLSQCLAGIMRHYQLKEEVKLSPQSESEFFFFVDSRLWFARYSATPVENVRFCASTCHLSIVIRTGVNSRVMGSRRI